MNQANLIGNLGAKPELRYLTNGDAVCEMRIATTERWRSNGEKREHTEWHRVIIWGAMGENAAKYLDKGSKVRITGRLRTRQWDDRDVVKRYTTEIRADEVEYLTAARRDEQPADDGQSGGYGAESGGGDGAQDDDIPFSDGGAPAEVEAPREVTQRAAAPAPAQRGSGAGAPAAGRAPAKSAASNRAPAKSAPAKRAPRGT